MDSTISNYNTKNPPWASFTSNLQHEIHFVNLIHSIYFYNKRSKVHVLNLLMTTIPTIQKQLFHGLTSESLPYKGFSR